MLICIATTIKAPAAEVTQFVDHHIACGIDKIFLCFDDPQDPVQELYADSENVEVIRCDDEYWRELAAERPDTIDERQILNVNRVAELAQAMGCEWLFHIDGDELLYSRRPIAEVLSEVDSDVVRLNLREAVSEQEEYGHIFEPDMFKVPPGKINKRIAKALGCRRAFWGNDYFRGHVDSKSAFRISTTKGRIGIHALLPDSPGLSTSKTKELLLLHYDCIGYTNWRDKWKARTDGSTKVLFLRKTRQQQMARFKELSQGPEQELKRLYIELHVLPKYEKLILSSLGLLERIPLEKSPQG